MGWEDLSEVILPLDSSMEFCGSQSLSMTHSPTTAASAGTEGPPGKTQLPWEWIHKGLSLCLCPGPLPTYSTGRRDHRGDLKIRNTDSPLKWHEEIRKSEEFSVSYRSCDRSPESLGEANVLVDGMIQMVGRRRLKREK